MRVWLSWRPSVRNELGWFEIELCWYCYLKLHVIFMQTSFPKHALLTVRMTWFQVSQCIWVQMETGLLHLVAFLSILFDHRPNHSTISLWGSKLVSKVNARLWNEQSHSFWNLWNSDHHFIWLFILLVQVDGIPACRYLVELISELCQDWTPNVCL